MEANREQAERALEMGQQYLRAGNPIKALRLFTKSKDMCSLSGINTWLAKAAAAVKKQQKAQSSNSSSSRPSGPGTSRQSASSARTNASSGGAPRMRRAASAPTTDGNMPSVDSAEFGEWVGQEGNLEKLIASA